MKTTCVSIIIFLFTVASSSAIATDIFYRGSELKQLCIGYQSGFSMGDFRRFKCEAYLMGYLDRHRQDIEKTNSNIELCLAKSRPIEALARAILEYYENDPSPLTQPAANSITHVLLNNFRCEEE